MNCDRVVENLSAYIDETLDSDGRTEVEEHLATCERCRLELQALRTCIEAVHSLERVPAPPGFLEKIRECTEQPSPWRRIVETLLLPWHVKLPLHLAGAVAMVFLILATTSLTRHGRDTLGPGQFPVSQTKDEVRPIGLPSTGNSGQERASESLLPAEGRVEAESLGSQARPFQLVLLIPRKESLPREISAEREDKGASPSLRHRGESTAIPPLQAGPEPLQPRSAAPPHASGSPLPRAQLEKKLDRFRDDDHAGKFDTAPKPQQASPVVGVAQERADLSPTQGDRGADKEAGGVDPDTHGTLMRWITDAGGTLHSVDREKGKVLPSSILFSIPAEIYPDLLRELRFLGELSYTPSSLPPLREHGAVFVHIAFTTVD